MPLSCPARPPLILRRLAPAYSPDLQARALRSLKVLLQHQALCCGPLIPRGIKTTVQDRQNLRIGRPPFHIPPSGVTDLVAQ